MNNTTGATQLLNADELAAIMGICATNIRRAARLKAIPCVKFGASVRFTPEQVATITSEGFSWPKKAKKNK